jgi:hypothetical protein
MVHYAGVARVSVSSGKRGVAPKRERGELGQESNDQSASYDLIVYPIKLSNVSLSDGRLGASCPPMRQHIWKYQNVTRQFQATVTHGNNPVIKLSTYTALAYSCRKQKRNTTVAVMGSTKNATCLNLNPTHTSLCFLQALPNAQRGTVQFY